MPHDMVFLVNGVCIVLLGIQMLGPEKGKQSVERQSLDLDREPPSLF